LNKQLNVMQTTHHQNSQITSSALNERHTTHNTLMLTRWWRESQKLNAKYTLQYLILTKSEEMIIN